MVINHPQKNMSYPMNEFVTDLENPAETGKHEAGAWLSTVMERGRDFCQAVGTRVGKDTRAANALVYRNPYPTLLVGIGAGALLGFLVACRRNGG